MLRKITTINPLTFLIGYQIYKKSFKTHQRRTLFDLIEKIRKHRCDFYVLEDSRRIVGILVSWVFKQFDYIEQFAIRSDLRGKNYGQRALQEYLQITRNPTVLEVDCSDEKEIYTRRIKFYKKSGFTINAFDYLEPSYGPNKIYVPGLILSYPRLLTADELNSIREILYTTIYEAPLPIESLVTVS